MDRDADFENALQNGGKVPSGGLVSVKSSINKIEKLGNQKKVIREGKSEVGVCRKPAKPDST